MAALRTLLSEHPGLATAKLRERTADGTGCARMLLHVVADRPGHVPEGPAAVAALVDAAFWGACRGGRLTTARYLAGQGADVGWIAAWEPATPLDAALRTSPDAADLLHWLRARGGKPAH